MSVPNSVGLSPVSGCLFSISVASVPISVAPPHPPGCLFSISMVSVPIYVGLSLVSGCLFSISMVSVPIYVGLSLVSGCLFSISMASVSISVAPPAVSSQSLWCLSLYLCRSLPCLFSISMVSACPCHCRSLACLFSISVVSVPTSLGLSPVSRGLAINNIFIHVFSVCFQNRRKTSTKTHRLSEPQRSQPPYLYSNFPSPPPTTSFLFQYHPMPRPTHWCPAHPPPPPPPTHLCSNDILHLSPFVFQRKVLRRSESDFSVSIASS